MRADSVEFIPVPSEPLCDFCSNPAPHRVEYACRDFELSAYNYRSRGSWHACQACSKLITAGEWEALKKRAIDQFHLASPSADRNLSESFVSALHHAFREHRE